MIAPGIGTIISAFLGSECQNETVYVGIGQALTTPILGLGFIWSIAWSIKLYKLNANANTNASASASAGAGAVDEESALISNDDQ